jgi:hypothetical protein
MAANVSSLSPPPVKSSGKGGIRPTVPTMINQEEEELRQAKQILEEEEDLYIVPARPVKCMCDRDACVVRACG